MKVYIIEPQVGVAPVRLGMTRDQVRQAMPEPSKSFLKTPDSEHETDAFDQSAFQVFYKGEPPLVEFIELSRCPHFRVFFEKLSIFDTPADHVLETLVRRYDYDSENLKTPCNVIFHELQMTLWRPHIPSSPDEEEGRYFATVGIGTSGYYSRFV